MKLSSQERPSTAELEDSIAKFLEGYEFRPADSFNTVRLDAFLWNDDSAEFDNINPGFKQKIRDHISTGHVVFLTGPQRCGKTSLLAQLDKEYQTKVHISDPATMKKAKLQTYLEECSSSGLPVLADEFMSCFNKPELLDQFVSAAHKGQSMVLDVPIQSIVEVTNRFDKNAPMGSLKYFVEVLPPVPAAALTSYVSSTLGVSSTDKLVTVIVALSGGSLSCAKSLLINIREKCAFSEQDVPTIISGIRASADEMGSICKIWEHQRDNTHPSLQQYIPDPKLALLYVPE